MFFLWANQKNNENKEKSKRSKKIEIKMATKIKQPAVSNTMGQYNHFTLED